MVINDKKQLLGRLPSLESAVLELGCGQVRRHPEAITVDVLDYPSVDIVGDVFDVLSEVPDASIDAIYSAHFFEHIENLYDLIGECARVLKPGGRLDVSVPHFSNPYFYSDPTHRSFFGLYTFSYYCEDDLFARRVPNYQKGLPLRLTGVQLIFGSTKPFYVRHAVKKVIGGLVNLSVYTQEFYEENLCNWFPCYSVRYRLEKLSGQQTRQPPNRAVGAKTGAGH